MSGSNQGWSRSTAAFQGCRSRKAGSARAISTNRRKMKSIWIGTGFSHHSVPSLSNTATRSSTGTGSDPSWPVVAETKSRIACLAGPSRQLVSAPAVPADGGAVLASALMPPTLGATAPPRIIRKG